jgi:hypothetical protein
VLLCDGQWNGLRIQAGVITPAYLANVKIILFYLAFFTVRVEDSGWSVALG